MHDGFQPRSGGIFVVFPFQKKLRQERHISMSLLPELNFIWANIPQRCRTYGAGSLRVFHLDSAHDGSRSDPKERGISRQKGRRVAAPANRTPARAFAQTAAHEIVSELRAHACPGGGGWLSRIHQAPWPARTAPAHHRLNLVLRFRNCREPSRVGSASRNRTAVGVGVGIPGEIVGRIGAPVSDPA